MEWAVVFGTIALVLGLIGVGISLFVLSLRRRRDES
jgi:hypothetical protein